MFLGIHTTKRGTRLPAGVFGMPIAACPKQLLVGTGNARIQPFGGDTI